MSGEIEAAGALATAGMAARAIESGGGREPGDGSPCANCATPVTGRYCAECGQPAHVHRTLGHFIEEAAHGLFHFDTKAWRTLPMAAFRPGTLTHEYVHGRRARYISPVALFLFNVFLMFFVFAVLGEVKGDRLRTTAELRAEVAQGEEAVRTLAAGAQSEETRATLDRARVALSDTRARLAKREKRIAEFQRVRERLAADEAKARAGNDEAAAKNIGASRAIIDRALANPSGPPDSVSATIDEKGEVNINLAAGREDGMQTLFEEIKAANAAGRVHVNTGIAAWDKAIHHRLENPELAWYKIQNTAYKFSFLLIPISLPFIWLLFFWKRGVTLFDHTVFALYSLSFMSFLFIVLAVAARAPSGIAGPVTSALATAMACAVPVHMFFQLKGGYGLGWFGALWRTGLLLVFSLIAMSIFLLSILLLGLLG